MKNVSKYLEIKNLIEKDRLDEAIEKLKLNITNNDLFNDIILQAARHSELKRLIRNDIITFEQINISKSKIRLSLIQLIEELETFDKENPKPNNNYKKKVFFIVLPFFLIFLIIVFKNSLLCVFENYINSVVENKKKQEIKTNTDTTKSDITNQVSSEKQNQEKKLEYPKKITEKGEKSDSSKILDTTIIIGQVLNIDNKGINQVMIKSDENIKVFTDEQGLFKLRLSKSLKSYPTKIYLYYSKDSLQGRELIRVGQKNVILRFKNK